MKNFKIFILLISFITLFSNCDKGEIFTGSPVGNQDIITLKGEVSTTESVALKDQIIPVYIKLPKTFASEATVEVSTFNKRGGRTRAYIKIPAGTDSANGKVAAVGGDIFDTTFDIQLTAISLETVEIGKQYLLTSDIIPIATGSSSVPDDDSSKLQIKLVWENAALDKNNIKLTVDRPSPISDAFPGITGSIYRLHNIGATTSTTPNGTGSSNVAGEYFLKISATNLIASSVDLKYKIILKFPDGSTKVYQGVYSGMTTDLTISPLKSILKITKSITGNDVIFASTDQGL